MSSQEQPPAIRDLIDLTGRVAIVTGGSRGFGFACARRLSEAGAAIVVVARNAERTHDAARRLETLGATAVAVPGDVTRQEEVDRAFDVAVRELGRIDVVVNSAGIYSNFPLADLEPEELRSILAVNVEGVHRCTRAAAAQMRRQQTGGSIVTITSIDAVHPTSIGFSHYTASKHALWGLTKALALELGPDGIRVNAVAPGPSLTEGVLDYLEAGSAHDVDFEAQWATAAARVPMRRWVDPDEVGRVCLFLASGLSSYVTGAQIVVDGGYLVG